MEKLIEMFADMLSEIDKHIKEDAHVFDANSDECKGCKIFALCKTFAPMKDKITKLDLDEKTYKEIIGFFRCIEYESMFIKNANKKDYTKALDVKFINYHRRFKHLTDFKHYDILVRNLTSEELNIIKKVIINSNKTVHRLFDKVLEANLNDNNFIISKLNKDVEDKIDYENMSKEELIELLNNK